jgi:hypothetical protein
MRISFACPSCAATGSASAAFAGKSARCKHCGHRFTIPGAEETEEFPLAEPAEEPAGAGYAVLDPVQVSAFVPSRSDELTSTSPRRRTNSASRSTTRTTRKGAPRSAWWTRLAWAAGAVVVAIAAIALLAPNGVLIAACIMMTLGSAMVLVGFGVGAYGAFSEDFVHGFFYLVLPLYTAYYMVTRWDDLWFWFACMTLGVGIILLGIEMARWGGVGA